MTFLLDIPMLKDAVGLPDFAKVMARFKAYEQYLETIRDRLPPSAYAFAAANWHFNHADHRCPHDAWVESLLLQEPSSGTRSATRAIAIQIRLLGAYHDGHIELSYYHVKRYSLAAVVTTPQPSASGGHGDWLIDEVRLSDHGLVEHEIIFSHQGHWLIECEDMTYRWQPFDITKQGSAV